MERLSFKEAMQEMMLDQCRAEQAAQAQAQSQSGRRGSSQQQSDQQGGYRTMTPQEKAGSLAKSWLGNIL